MKKLLAILLSLTMVLSLASCGSQEPPTAAPTEAPATETPTVAPATEEPMTEPSTEAPTTEAPTTEPPTTEPTTEAPTEAPGPRLLTYQEYAEAPLDSEVIIQGTVQLMAYNTKEKTANIFLADEDGAYYVYQMTVSRKDSKSIKEGTVLQVKGFKTEWSGEIEITDGEYEILKDQEGVSPKAVDLTAMTDEAALKEQMNRRVSFSDGYVVASTTEDGGFAPFLYGWNGAGSEGDDLYFRAAFGDRTLTFVVESDEFDPDTDLYKAVQALEIDQMLDLESFLYWYEGPQPHVCGLKAAPAGTKPEGVMTYDEYVAAAADSEVTVEGYIQQAAFNADNGFVNLFLADGDAAYFIFRMNCTAEEAANMQGGQKIRVTGLKTEWNGQVEISDGKFVPMEGTYLNEPFNVTKLLGKEEELKAAVNRRIGIRSAQVTATKDADDEDQPFLYKYNGSGEDGDDLYFTVTVAGSSYVMVVESDEYPAGSEIYEAVKKLKIGDTIDLEGFLYWYEGPQPHIYSVKESEAPALSAMSYADFLAAEPESEVMVDAYIQQMSRNEESGKYSLFLAAPQDEQGLFPSYYVYDMELTEEEAEELQQFDHILVTGFKGEWSGETEILDASFEKLEGSFQSDPIPADELFARGEALDDYMNARISLKAVTVIPSLTEDGEAHPFLYQWNGTGEEGDDIYFKALAGGREYTFVVESDEFGPDSAEYQAAQTLKIGDVLELEAFLYWYEGPQPHISFLNRSYLKSSEEVSTFGEYFLAEPETEITVEGYVRLVSSYQEEEGQGYVNVYLDDNNGGYYIYKLPVEEEQLEELNADSVLLQVKGYRGEWSGMIEVTDVSEWTVLEPEAGPGMDGGSLDMTGLLQMEDTASLNYFIARPISLKTAIVVPSRNEAGEEFPFLYQWNGTGEEGDDIYFNVRLDETVLTVTVEADECGPDSKAYREAQGLSIGDVIDLEGFLYWYEGPQPHITVIDGFRYAKQENALTYYEYMAAEKDAAVAVDGYVQSYTVYEKNGEIFANLFLHDRIGAYYVYALKLTEEEAQEFTELEGVRMMIRGYRSEWSGEIEVTDAESYEIYRDENDTFLAKPADITEILGDEEALAALMNCRTAVRGAEVIASEASDGTELPFLYKWNGTGDKGDDLYFKVRVGEHELTLVVEADEYNLDTELYQAVEALNVGDKVDLTAFLYWYEGPQPHLSGLAPAAEPAE